MIKESYFLPSLPPNLCIFIFFCLLLQKRLSKFSMSLPVLFSGYMPTVLLAIGVVVLICWQRLSVQLEPQEPPLLKPSVPYIGHIIGIIRYKSGYFDKLKYTQFGTFLFS